MNKRGFIRHATGLAFTMGFFAETLAVEKSTHETEWTDTFIAKMKEIKNIEIKSPAPDVVSRIKDSYRNSPPDDLIPLILLAAAREWDFIILIWCSSSNRRLRTMAYLLVSSVYEKNSRDFQFDFSSKLSLYNENQSNERREEIEWINKNMKEISVELAEIVGKFDPKWAATILD